MTAMADVRTEKHGRAGLITLNRPKALNALTHDMCLEMIKALQAWGQDDSVDVVIVRGKGEKAFCAGGDIRLLHDSGKAGDGKAYLFWRDEYRLNHLIKRYPKPYVALIDGIVMGGGVGVSVHGRFRVAGDRTLMAMPETGIGFYPDVGGTYFLPRLPGWTGYWMGLTGARLKAADTLALGVATHFVASDRHADLTKALSEGGDVEKILAKFASDPGPAGSDDARNDLDKHFSKESVADIVDSLNAADDAWTQKQLLNLAAKSPTAVLLTFEALRRGEKLSFEDAMRQELRLSIACLSGRDFYEGVRAVVIDKDQSPAWSPGHVDDVDQAVIEAAFTPLADDQEMTFLEDA